MISFVGVWGLSVTMEVMCPGIVSCADIIIGRFVAK